MHVFGVHTFVLNQFVKSDAEKLGEYLNVIEDVGLNTPHNALGCKYMPRILICNGTCWYNAHNVPLALQWLDFIVQGSCTIFSLIKDNK